MRERRLPLLALALLCLPIGFACDGAVDPPDGSAPGRDGAIDAAASDGAVPGDAAAPDGCVPMCEGLSCGDDGCGGSCGTCGDGLGCDAGRCLADCDPGCTRDCPQGCFDLGACADTGGALDLHGNVYTAGVVLSPSGAPDDALVHYRAEGEATWWQAPPSAALPDGRLATSLFSLRPDTAYEIRAEAGGAVACGSVRTRPVDPLHARTRTVYVDAAAAAGGDGSAGAPFRTVQEGVDAAGPGVDVVVRAGIYREEVRVRSGGEEGAFLRVVGEPGAVLDGTDPVSPTWTADGAGVWHTPWSGDPRYAGADDQRLYHFLSLAGLRSGTGDDGEPIDEGFIVDGGRLYVRSASDPSARTFHLPVRNTAIAVQADHVWIEGLEIRWYGEGGFAKGVDIDGADHVVVRGCHIHELPSPVWSRRGSNDVWVQDNHIHQSRIYTWPWAAVKGTDHENSAITQGGGRGFIASGNRIHDIFNGIYAGSFSNDRDPSIAFDVDVYANRMERIGDDALEPEGACVNHRYRGNVSHGVHNGLSLAPITFGPVFALRNRFTDYERSGFKLSNGSSGRVWLFHNTCWTDRPETNGLNVSNPITNMVFRNNIVRGTRYALEMTAEVSGNDLDHDNWYTPRGAPEIKWSNVRYDDVPAWCAATGLECAAVLGEPGLSDPAGGRWALGPESPNVDAAVRIYGINDEYAGAGPDLGYVELGSPEP